MRDVQSLALTETCFVKPLQPSRALRASVCEHHVLKAVNQTGSSPIHPSRTSLIPFKADLKFAPDSLHFISIGAIKETQLFHSFILHDKRLQYKQQQQQKDPI